MRDGIELFACGRPRATALRQRFFACGETALPSLPALAGDLFDYWKMKVARKRPPTAKFQSDV